VVTAGEPWTEGDERAPIAMLPISVQMHWSNWLFTNVTGAELTLKGTGGYHYNVQETYSVSHS
jgi:hypothetical protein